MGKKIKIYCTEQYTTYLKRESVIIDLDDYPELQDLSDEEIGEYVFNNDVSPTNESFSSLYEELSSSDVYTEQICDESMEIKVEEVE